MLGIVLCLRRLWVVLLKLVVLVVAVIEKMIVSALRLLVRSFGDGERAEPLQDSLSKISFRLHETGILSVNPKVILLTPR